MLLTGLWREQTDSISAGVELRVGCGAALLPELLAWGARRDEEANLPALVMHVRVCTCV